ncbi:hypothetical protein PV02_04960 [Methanolobus chelungpuianus]|uniref:HEPN domain-containing protein n=2 Tax=Methanolobus chelungpuianus TaxID=502115 RepID=A0AAE3KX01_9EURY|nr:hypothetical protein [Methanolobus chelungpuianus]
MYMDLLEGTIQKRMRHADDGSTGLQNSQYKVCVINSANEPLQRALLVKYGVWYELCRRLALEHLGRGRDAKYEGFTGLHEKILSLINLKDPATNSNEKKHLKDGFLSSFDTQVNMLYTIEPLIASAKDSYRKMITAELVSSALDEAESLYRQGLLRAAGIMAGFALERYLRTLCEVSGIGLEPDDKMATMARKLLSSDGLYGLDPEILGPIDHFAFLRDECTRQEEEPQEHEVRELIDKAREIIFLAFC